MRVRVIMAILVFSAVALLVAAPVGAQDAPDIPVPVAVALDHETTALLVLDMIESICNRYEVCVNESAPAMGALLTRARGAGVYVVHTGTSSPAVAPVARLLNEPTLDAPADKFFGSELNDLLTEHGIRTVVIGGWAGNRAVLYTSYGAAARGYTVVVPVDGAVAALPFMTIATQYQMLNTIGSPNVDNVPLAPGAVTLSHTDLIAFE